MKEFSGSFSIWCRKLVYLEMNNAGKTIFMILPPLVLVAYRRAELLGLVLDAISHQTVLPPQIIAYVDGPKSSKEDLDDISAVVKQLKSYTLVPIEVIQRESNFGCRENFLRVIQEVTKLHPSVVFLEEDLLPSPHFYETAIKVLETYWDDPRILTFCCNPEPLLAMDYCRNHPEYRDEILKNEAEWFATDAFRCHGWGTWQHKWQPIAEQVFKPLNVLQLLALPWSPFSIVTLFGHFAAFRGAISCWAYTVTEQSKRSGYLHLVPRKSQIKHIGSGTLSATNLKKIPLGEGSLFDPDYRPDNYDYLNLISQLGPKASILACEVFLKRVMNKLKSLFRL
jgi:hypothetical protein